MLFLPIWVHSERVVFVFVVACRRSCRAVRVDVPYSVPLPAWWPVDLWLVYRTPRLWWLLWTFPLPLRLPFYWPLIFWRCCYVTFLERGSDCSLTVDPCWLPSDLTCCASLTYSWLAMTLWPVLLLPNAVLTLLMRDWHYCCLWPDCWLPINTATFITIPACDDIAIVRSGDWRWRSVLTRCWPAVDYPMPGGDVTLLLRDDVVWAFDVGRFVGTFVLRPHSLRPTFGGCWPLFWPPMPFNDYYSVMTVVIDPLLTCNCRVLTVMYYGDIIDRHSPWLWPAASLVIDCDLRRQHLPVVITVTMFIIAILQWPVVPFIRQPTIMSLTVLPCSWPSVPELLYCYFDYCWHLFIMPFPLPDGAFGRGTFTPVVI